MPLPQLFCFDNDPFSWGVYPLTEETMNTKTSNSSTVNNSSRCQYHFANGKRCRLSGLDSQFGLCLHHFTASAAMGISHRQSQPDSDDLSAELLPELSEFQSAVDVNQFLARLLIQVTKGRVTPRRAAVLAYITNQLLHSHRSISREQALDDGPIRLDFGDLPRPGRAAPDTLAPLRGVEAKQ
jgi:hypothetical protein